MSYILQVLFYEETQIYDTMSVCVLQLIILEPTEGFSWYDQTNEGCPSFAQFWPFLSLSL